MKLSVVKYGMMVLALAAFVGCGKNKSSDSVSVNGRDGRAVSGPSGLPTNQVTLAGSSVVTVSNVGRTSSQITDAAKAFVSSFMDTGEVGTVDLNGIQFGGKVTVNQTTGVAQSTSYIQVVIKDSYANNGSADPIIVKVAGAQGAASNGQVNLVFSDEYGSITITGTFNQSNFSGKIDFNNTKGNGYNGVKSGTLGTFTIGTCVFFVCQ